jgi:hypothetical protein
VVIILSALMGALRGKFPDPIFAIPLMKVLL